MCGRFVSTTPPDDIARYFGAEAVSAPTRGPDYNVAPTRDVYAVREDGSARQVDALHWGLVPRWAKDPGIGSRMINARAETVAEKNAFRAAFRKRRCIIPADGFYEWTRVPGQKAKQPWFLHRADGEPLAFAGLWETWRAPDADDELSSCTIITGPANERVAEIHDRMPIILPPERWDDWLDPSQQDTELLGRFLVPAPPELITFHPVSTEVNKVANNRPALLERVEIPEVAGDGGNR